MRAACLFLLYWGLVTSSMVLGSDSISDLLVDVQERQQLQIPESSILQNRVWQDSMVKESLSQYLEARNAIRQGNNPVAIGLLSRATQLDQDNAAAWLALANLWEQQRQSEIAMEAWRQVFRINPGNLEALYAIGMRTFREGDVQEAARLLTAWRIEEGQEVLRQTRPDRVLYAEGALAHCMDVLDESEIADALRRSIRTDIEGLRRGSAGMSISIGLWKQIIAQLRSVSAYESAFEVESIILPLVQKKNEKLMDWYRDLISHAILFDDGSALSAVISGIDEETLAMFTSDMSSRQIRASLLYQAAALYNMLGNDDAAAWLYEDVLEYDPSNVMARNNLGYHLLDQNRMDEYLRRLIDGVWRDAPDDSAILDTYGWMQYLQDRFEDEEGDPGALSLLEEANQRSGDNPSPEILNHLGDTQYRLGDIDAARESWTTALSIVQSDERRAVWILSSTQLQETLWDRQLRDPSTLYDLTFGELQFNLQAKLAALDSGTPCEVRPTFSELKIQY